ncbi:MAG: hypothetical protein AAF960_15035 [Bacteroidota bacterium]
MEKQTLFWLFIGIFAVTAIITLLGITGVIKNIKERYLNTLFTALILEVVAAVVLLFQGNFITPAANLSDIIKEAGYEVPETPESQEKFILEKLTLVADYEDLETEVETLKTTLSAKEKELEKVKGAATKYDRNFYANIIKLDDAIVTYIGRSINIAFQPEQKEAVYRLLVKIFGDIGKVRDGDAVYNSDKTVNKDFVQDIYKEFRASYGRPVADDAQVHITPFDVSQMVRAYLEHRKIQPNYQVRFNIQEDL